jgi:hypothetical protein
MVFVRAYIMGVLIVGTVLALLVTIWASAGGSVAAQPAAAPSLFPDTAATPQQQATALCQQVSDIPISECEALVTLYNATAGTEWITSTNWLTVSDTILERYQAQLNDRHPNVIFWVRNTDIEAIASAVSTLGDALQRAIQDNATSGIVSAVRNAQYVDTNQCGPQQFALQPPDELIGADTFAANMQRAFPADDRFGVSAAAGDLLTALEQVRSSSRVGRPHIAPRELWEYDDTITILAPLPRDVPPAVAWRTSIYTSTMPLTATWSPVPTQTVVISSSFAYVRDGTWDDFLSAWYTTPLIPTVGQWCQYIPPAFVSSEISETLFLTLTTVTDTAVQLDWNPTDHEEATGYELYVQAPYDLSWTLEVVLPPEQTSALVGNLEPDSTYRYLVVARDPNEDVVAESNSAQWPVAATRKLFLPFVIH